MNDGTRCSAGHQQRAKSEDRKHAGSVASQAVGTAGNGGESEAIVWYPCDTWNGWRPSEIRVASCMVCATRPDA
jgi:hypothetical protein